MDNNNNKLITSIYRKKTFTGLLMNFQSFTCFSYKLGLIKTLIDRTFKINNTLGRLSTSENVSLHSTYRGTRIFNRVQAV